MPTDTNLPTMVHLYLELIEKLISLQNGLDSSSAESKMIQNQIALYFDKIDGEMVQCSVDNK